MDKVVAEDPGLVDPAAWGVATRAQGLKCLRDNYRLQVESRRDG